MDPGARSPRVVEQIQAVVKQADGAEVNPSGQADPERDGRWQWRHYDRLSSKRELMG